MLDPKTSRWLAAMAAATGFCVQACSPPATSMDGSSSTPSGAAAGDGTVMTTQSPGAGNPDGSLVGKWMSASCGERTYARLLDLAADGTFDCADMVSPCPPEVICVWSGIVHRRGTYTVADGRITLMVSNDGGLPGRPLPASLGVDPVSGAPFEIDSGDKACAYVRQE